MYPEDSEGKMIAVDNIVAFNQSGAVRRGRVMSISRRTDSIAQRHPNINSIQWVIEIERNGKASVVKNTDGILVLY